MGLGPNILLSKEVVAKTAVTKYRFVRKDTTEDQFSHATAVGDAILGSSQADAVAGARFELGLMGLLKIEYGGTVAEGDPLTCDASGKAVKAIPAAGVNNRIGGFAAGEYVSGDIGLYLAAPGQIQG